MSKLYLRADTDMIKTTHTARGNKRVDASVGYDEGRYDKQIKMQVTRDDEKIFLEIFDKNSIIITCEGTLQDGITKCEENQIYTIK